MFRDLKSFIGFQLSRRGVGYIFGVDTVHEYCKKLNIDLIVRAHQVCIRGNILTENTLT